MTYATTQSVAPFVTCDGVANADCSLATILRVSLGGLFLAHAGLKLFVFTPAGTVGYFASSVCPALCPSCHRS